MPCLRGWDVALAVSAALACGCATAHNYLEPDRPLYQSSFAPPAADRPVPGTIRVVTYNIEVGARHLSRRGFAWPTRGIGQTSTLLRFSFDHVLVRGLAPAAEPARGVLRDVPKGISDHFPVWTSLRFE